jgi:hypothetical protein
MKRLILVFCLILQPGLVFAGDPPGLDQCFIAPFFTWQRVPGSWPEQWTGECICNNRMGGQAFRPGASCEGSNLPNADGCNPGQQLINGWCVTANKCEADKVVGDLSVTGGTVSQFGGCNVVCGWRVGMGNNEFATNCKLTGEPATAGTVPADLLPPEAPKPKSPPCSSDQGVFTSSSGKVTCLKESNTLAIPTTPPKVSTSASVSTFPDNSVKTVTTTKTVDTVTNAADISTSTTVTPGSGGSSQAGTPGTTSKTTATTGIGTSTTPTTPTTPDSPPNVGGMPSSNGTLYTERYPDGLSGIFSSNYAAMRNSPLFGLVGSLAPSGLSSSGSCPSWSFNANIGPLMSFGSASFAPPCWLWTALRSVFLISALFMARRLIFGG